MNKTIIFFVSFFAVHVAWAQQPSTAAPNGSTQTVNTDTVPIEEYVPKVIIKGKWGTGPGEFGMASRYPLGLYDQYVPSSLAVDSKGNIYVLDFVNNRIQKFNTEGKYLTFLPIEGLKGELAGYCAGDTCYEVPPAPGVKYDRPVIGRIEAIGINIVIDSKDTLYYYLKRVKDGKETGEVWEFKDDKLVQKDTQMAPIKKPEGIPANQYIDSKIDAEVKVATGKRKFDAIDKKKRSLMFNLDDGEELYGQRRVLFNEASKKWFVRIKRNGKVWDKIYGPSGKLLSITEVPRLSEFLDSKGNYYFIETSDTGLVVKENQLIRILK